jgi:hypothetical protein
MHALESEERLDVANSEQGTMPRFFTNLAMMEKYA